MTRGSPDFSGIPLALIFPLFLAFFTLILSPGLNHLSYLLMFPGLFDRSLKTQVE